MSIITDNNSPQRSTIVDYLNGSLTSLFFLMMRAEVSRASSCFGCSLSIWSNSCKAIIELPLLLIRTAT